MAGVRLIGKGRTVSNAPWPFEADFLPSRPLPLAFLPAIADDGCHSTLVWPRRAIGKSESALRCMALEDKDEGYLLERA